VTLIASCAMHDIEPWSYLRDVLMLLPVWKLNAVEDLHDHLPGTDAAMLAFPGLTDDDGECVHRHRSHHGDGC
jgi:hypothetical protein